MLKHVSHRSTTSLGGLQRGVPNRRASVPSRPFSRQPSEGTICHVSTPAACRRSTTHSPDTGMPSSCMSTPGVHRRISQSPEILVRPHLPTTGDSGGSSPEVSRRPEPRGILHHRRPPDEPPPRLGRSMSTPAGCRYPPPGASPVQATPPDSPRYKTSKDYNALFAGQSKDPGIGQGNQAGQYGAPNGVPEAPRSSTLPRRPMSRGATQTPHLLSAMSYSSLPPGGRTSLSARSSSTSSLSDTIVGYPGSGGSKVPVRIHLRQLRPDIEYKTIRLDAETSCRQLIEHLLQKLRLKHRDPNLFAVVLEAAVKGPGGAPPVKRRFLLEDSARPVELQQCRPRGEANFSISMRRGGVLRVRDSVLTPGSQYKSLLVSYTSSAVDVVQLLLRCNNRPDHPQMFTLHETCSDPYHDRPLDDQEKPLELQVSWPKDERQKYSLVLRRNLTQGLLEKRQLWRLTSMDQHSSTDTESEADDLLPAIRMTSSSYGAPPNFLSSASSTPSTNLLASSTASSNRSSISSTSSSSSASSTSGSSGSSYFAPPNLSRISCDSGFSSIASSPQPQTPPMRTLIKSGGTNFLGQRGQEPNQLQSQTTPSQDCVIKHIQTRNHETNPINQRPLLSAGVQDSNSQGSTHHLNTQGKQPPPPPPRVPPRQYQSKLQKQLQQHVQEKRKQEQQARLEKNQSHQNQNDPSNQISKQQEKMQESDRKVQDKHTSHLQFLQDQFNQSDETSQTISHEIKNEYIAPSIEITPVISQKLSTSTNDSNLIPRPGSLPSIPCRPSQLLSSQSTPSIKQMLFKYIPSPSASSQYNPSSQSSPSSQIPYASLTPTSGSPSPTSTFVPPYGHSVSNLTRTEWSKVQGAFPGAQENKVPNSSCSSNTILSPKQTFANTTNPKSTDSNSLHSASLTTKQNSNPLIQLNQTRTPNPPAVPPRHHYHSPVRQVKNIQQPAMLETLSYQAASTPTASMQLHPTGFQHPNLSSPSLKPTVNRTDKIACSQNTNSNKMAGQSIQKSQEADISAPSSPPSTSPPPLPSSSPPPLTPRGDSQAFLFPSSDVNNGNFNIRRSSFPSASTLLKCDFGKGFSSPPYQDHAVSSTNTHFNYHILSDKRNHADTVQARNSTVENEEGSSDNLGINGALRGSGSNIAPPSLPVRKQAMQAEKELQKAIDSLKQLTTHDLLNAQDLIYI